MVRLIMSFISYFPVSAVIKFYLFNPYTANSMHAYISLLYNLFKPQHYTSMKRKEPQQSKKLNILQIQKDLLVKALSSSEGPMTWKILVFDAYNRGIVSSQLKMKDLRDQNITLYLNLNDDREQIHGITVVYLVQPTLENIEAINNDLLEELYSSVFIHFSSEPAPNILPVFAKKLSSSKRSQVVSRIAKIEYSCVGYYPIDQSMCILPTQIEIVNFLRSLNYQPIFVYNSSNEQSKGLVDRIKGCLSCIGLEKQVKTTGTNNVVFYIFNRDSDLFPVLSHGITYGSLLENLYKINKFGTKVTKNKETVELSLQDDIWVEKKNYLISQMKLGELSNEISSKLIGLSSEEFTESNEKLKKIQWHLNNAGEMISQAKNRRLNEFYEAELEIYNKSLVSKELKRDIINLLQEAPNQEDKIRLLLIYLTYCDNIDELGEFESAFPDISKQTKFVELKEKKHKGMMPESASNKYIKKFAKGIWKNLIAGDKKFRMTKQIEKVKSSQFTELTESGLTIEPLSPIGANTRIHRHIVYSLGGGCFHEYGNLMEFHPDVVYASDQLISYREFI